MVKKVPFFPNSKQNDHCLQACAKSILAYYKGDEIPSDTEIDQETGYIGGWTWLPPTAAYLSRQGLEAKLYSPFNYLDFSINGVKYLEEVWRPQRLKWEQENGGLDNIAFCPRSH